MKNKLFVLLAAFGVCGAVVAQEPGFQPAQLPRQQQPISQGAGSTAPDEVRSAGLFNSMELLDNSIPLQPDYLLSFRIVEDKGEPIRLRVQDSGDIQAPYVNLVRAAGKTCRELAFTIKKELEKSYFKTATVIIAIDQIPKNPMAGGGGGGGMVYGMDTFTVFGQVLRAGKYELSANEDLTVSQAVLRAGGPAAFANLKKVNVIRKTPHGNKKIQVNVEAIMKQGVLDQDIYIRNNDVLIIPEKVANF